MNDYKILNETLEQMKYPNVFLNLIFRLILYLMRKEKNYSTNLSFKILSKILEIIQISLT